MPELVECVIEDERWDTLDLETLAEAACRAALAQASVAPEGREIALLACDDARIAALNADFRGKGQPTNVLSWPAHDLAPASPGDAPPPPPPDSLPEGPPDSLGDIAIAWDTCLREATEQGLPMADHVSHLIVHGTLHLLGYDHVADADASRMQRIETLALARLGIADPY